MLMAGPIFAQQVQLEKSRQQTIALYYQKTQPRSHGGLSRKDFSKILHIVTTQLQFLLIAVAGWMSRHQQAVIEYLQEENRILLEQKSTRLNSSHLGISYA